MVFERLEKNEKVKLSLVTQKERNGSSEWCRKG